MKTVLLTGSEGNIGTYIVRRLHEIHPNWKILRIKHRKVVPGFDLESGCYEGDVCDPELLRKIFSDHAVDYVVHAASQSYRHTGYRDNPFQVLDNDSSSLLNLLRYCGDISKIVYISSALLYEHAVSSPLKEEDTNRIPAPSSSYGVAKYFGEHAVRMFAAESGVQFTIWRPFNIVSPLEPHDGDGRHVFVDFFRKLLIEKVAQFSVLGSGNQIRCFMWVEDAASCIVDNIENKQSNGHTFNLAKDEPITLLKLKDMLLDLGYEAGIIPNDYYPKIITQGFFSGIETEVRIPSVAKLKDILCWESPTSVRECFRLFIQNKFQL